MVFTAFLLASDKCIMKCPRRRTRWFGCQIRDFSDNGMKWLKRLLTALALLLVIAAAAPFLYALDDYIPRIEKEVAARLKEPVTIKSLRLAVLPVPHVTVGGITVGTTADLTLGKVVVTPDLGSLFAATRVIKSIELTSLVLTQKALDKIPVWSKADSARPAAQPAPVRIDSIRLDDALVKLDKASFGPFDALVNLDRNGEPVAASISTRDGKIMATIKPDKSNYLIDATAKAWKLPAGPAIEFDELIIRGVATLTSADLTEISAKPYGGAVNGRATATWQKGLQLKGRFDISRVELKSLVPLVSPGTRMSGRLNAKPVFSATAADVNQILSALHLETPFDVQNGILYGVDIQKSGDEPGQAGCDRRRDAL